MKPVICPICNGSMCSNIDYCCIDCFHGFDNCLQSDHKPCHCLLDNILEYYFKKYPQFEQIFVNLPVTNPEKNGNKKQSKSSWRLKRIIDFIEMNQDLEINIFLENYLFEID